MANEKLVVGIPGYVGDGIFGVARTYLQWVESLGFNARILTPHEPVIKEIDMLLLTGGPDLNPANYGQAPSYYTGSADPFKEYFFRERLQGYIDINMPIFGICLGHQMLNVKFGGGLEQHLELHPTTSARRIKGHEVSWIQLNQNTGKYTKWKGDVNSHHHQGVLISQVADDFDIVAVEQEGQGNKVVEAIRHKTLPIAGVQWHPEEWPDSMADDLVREILGLQEKTIQVYK